MCVREGCLRGLKFSNAGGLVTCPERGLLRSAVWAYGENENDERKVVARCRVIRVLRRFVKVYAVKDGERGYTRDGTRAQGRLTNGRTGHGG